MKELFFNHPTKQWHFEGLLKKCGLSRAQTNEWLKKLQAERLVKRVKPAGKMPYYVANYEEPHYQNSKRFFGLTALHEVGLLDYLVSLEKTDSVILFGSFARWDWHEGSDIDLFVYGDVDEVLVGRFAAKLKREIQIFSARNQKDLTKMGGPLLRNILKGMTIKGNIPLEVIKNAAV